MINIISYKTSKDNSSSKINNSSTVYNNTFINSNSTQNGGNLDSASYYTKSEIDSMMQNMGLWMSGSGYNSLFPKNSNNITTNPYEVAVGKFNKSNNGQLFSVGNGTSNDDRSNVFWCDNGGVYAPNLTSNMINAFTVNTTNILADKGEIGDLTSNTLRFKNGFGKNLTVESLEVTKAAHFFSLIIDEVKSVGGRLILTPANATLDIVEEYDDYYRCFWKATDKERKIYQTFEKGDQVICQTFNAAKGVNYNVSNKFYFALCINAPSDVVTKNGQDYFYIDISKNDKDELSNSYPQPLDKIVQLGNRTDTDRQSAIILSAYRDSYLDPEIAAPSLVQYKGINDYNLSTHRLNYISASGNKFVGDFSSTSGDFGDLNKQLEDLWTALDKEKEDRTLLGTQIEQTKSQITLAAEKLQELSGQVTANTASIKVMNDNISSEVTMSAFNELGKKVKENSSKIDQNATAITSTVTSMTDLQGQVSKNTSQIKQLADEISIGVTDEELKRTGIDIKNRTITLSAENTKIDGNLSLYGSDDGFTLYDSDGYPRTSIQTKEIGDFDPNGQGRILRIRGKMVTVGNTSPNSVTQTFTLKNIPKGSIIKVNKAYTTIWNANDVQNVKYNYKIRYKTSTLATFSGDCRSVQNDMPYPYLWYYGTGQTTAVSGDASGSNYTLESTVSFTGSFNSDTYIYQMFDLTIKTTKANVLASDGMYLSTDNYNFSYFGPTYGWIRHGPENGIKISQSGLSQSYYNNEIELGTFRKSYHVTKSGDNYIPEYYSFIEVGNIYDNNDINIILPPISGKMWYIKNISDNRCYVKCMTKAGPTVVSFNIYPKNSNRDNSMEMEIGNNFTVFILGQYGLYQIS